MQPLRAAAARRGRPIRLSIGHSQGRVEQFQIAVDGTLHPYQLQTLAPTATEPIWSRGIPEDTRLLAYVRAAHRAGYWRVAQQAAARATQHLIARHGHDHPYAAMGIELQAHFALMAQDRTTGSALSTEAAVAIHRLGGPPVQWQLHLTNGVAAWLHSERDSRPGFAVAHALIRITPSDHAALGAVLRRLAKDRE